MKFYIGQKFTYLNHNGSQSETVEIVATRGAELVFESKYTTGMTLPGIKIQDMIEKGKLTILNNCPVS